MRLRCSGWPQLLAIYQRDLSRGRVFLKTERPPRVGTPVRIRLLLPSGASLELAGSVIEQTTEVPSGRAGEARRDQTTMTARGSGAVVALDELAAPVRLTLETAVRTASEHGRRKNKPPPPREPEPLSADAGAPMLGAEDDLIAALEVELETYSRLNPFQILGVGYRADTRAIHTAFAELSRRFHPDRFVRYQSSEVSTVAEALFIAARRAFRALATPEQRDATLAEIRAGREVPEPPEPEQPIEPPLDPLRAFPDAVPLFEAARWNDAVDFFYEAARGDPGREAARIGVELASGMRALAAGDRLEAAERFHGVLERHPDNEVAARELAGLRRAITAERQTHLAKLMTTTGDDA